MHASSRARGRGEDGAAALEFAIVGVIVIVLVLGALEWGLWIMKYQGLASGAREGARVAAVQEDANGNDVYTRDDVVFAIDQAAASAGPHTGGVTIEIVGGSGEDCKDPTDNQGNLVKVYWDQDFNIPQITPLPFHPWSTRRITGVFRCE
jgi:Flp pilus assembly protein TadG